MSLAIHIPNKKVAINQNTESAFAPKQNFSTIDSFNASRGIPFCTPMHQSRIVITGVGLTSPNGNSLEEYRKNLLDGVARIQMIDMRYMGPKGATGQVPAGVCDFDPKKHQTRKELRVGTRAGSIAIFAAREAIASSAGTVPTTM